MLHCPRISTRLLVTCGAFFSAGLVSAHAADPTGDWRVAEGLANIRVAECNGAMWGAVSWEKNLGGIDKNNPDATKQTRPTLAMPILLNMKKKPGADQWEGIVYNSKDGKSYSSTIKPVGTDQLEIQGCVLGFLCGGETWTRVSGPIPSSPTNAPKGAKQAPAKAGTTAAVAPPPPKPPAGAPPRPPGQKTAPSAPGQTADIGDICLIPDIAKPPPAKP